MQQRINYKKIEEKIRKNIKTAFLKELGFQFLGQTLSRFLFAPAVKKENLLSSIASLPEKMQNKIYEFASKSEGHSLLAGALFGHHYYGAYVPKAMIKLYDKINRNVLLGTISHMGRNLYNLAVAVDDKIDKITNTIAHYVTQYAIDKKVKNPKIKQFVAGLLETYGSPRIMQTKELVAPFVGIASLPYVVKKLQDMKGIKEEQIMEFVNRMYQTQQEPYDLIDKVNLIAYQQRLNQGAAPTRKKEEKQEEQ